MRLDILKAIDTEREKQSERWQATDHKNTPNDWLAYIAAYTGKAYSIPFNEEQFRANLVKVAALAVAALEQPMFPRNSLEK